MTSSSAGIDLEQLGDLTADAVEVGAVAAPATGCCPRRSRRSRCAARAGRPGSARPARSRPRPAGRWKTAYDSIANVPYLRSSNRIVRPGRIRKFQMPSRSSIGGRSASRSGCSRSSAGGASVSSRSGCEVKTSSGSIPTQFLRSPTSPSGRQLACSRKARPAQALKTCSAIVERHAADEQHVPLHAALRRAHPLLLVALIPASCSPQAAAREARTLGERLELRPAELRVDARAHAAIGARDHVLPCRRARRSGRSARRRAPGARSGSSSG